MILIIDKKKIFLIRKFPIYCIQELEHDLQRFRMDGMIDYRYTYYHNTYTIFNKMENSTIVLPKSSRLNNLEYILARSTSNRMVLPRHQHLKMLNGKTVSQKTNSKVSSNHHTTKTIHLFVTSKQIGSENMSKSLNIQKIR